MLCIVDKEAQAVIESMAVKLQALSQGMTLAEAQTVLQLLGTMEMHKAPAPAEEPPAPDQETEESSTAEAEENKPPQPGE